jgi:hypothetical protein
MAPAEPPTCRRSCWRAAVERWPSAGLARAPRPAPRPPSGRCRPQRSSSAAGAGPRPPPGCPAQRLGSMLGLVPPDDHGEERRLLLPAARHGHPEPGPGDAAVGVPDLGLVGEVAGEAHARLGHGPAPSCCLAGRSALPLEPGDGGHRGMPRDHQGQAVEPTKSAQPDQPPAQAGSRAELVGGRLRLGVGHPVPSGQIPPPWAWWENEAPATTAARQLGPGSAG